MFNLQRQFQKPVFKAFDSISSVRVVQYKMSLNQPLISNIK